MGLPKDLVDRVEAIDTFSDKLLSFGQTTDHEFVELSHSVGSVQSNMQSIAVQAENLLGELDGSSSDNAFQAAFEVGKRAIELVHASIGLDYALGLQFEAIDNLLRTCDSVRSEYEKNCVIFRCLAVGFSIESARCQDDQKGIFMTVANDFRGIDQTMTEMIEKSFRELQDVLAEAARQRSSWKSKISRSGGSLEERLDTLRDELYTIEVELAPCSGYCQTIIASTSKLLDSLNPIIVSLQSQDIVRQQLEHVADGFADLKAIARKSGSGKTEAILLSSRVQARQLQAAEDEIRQAGEQSLQGIRDAIKQSSDIMELMGKLESQLNRHFGQDSFVSTFGEQIADLTEVVAASHTIHNRIAALDQNIHRVINTFTKEINTRQQDIRLTALNAQVAAARLESGGALERLAQETNSVVAANESTSNKLTHLLSDALKSFSESQDASQQQLQQLEAEQETLVSLTADTDARLGLLVKNMLESSHTMNRDYLATGRKVQSLDQQITFPHEIDRDFGPARSALDEIENRCLNVLGTKWTPSKESERALETHERRYTSQVERNIHRQSVTEVAAASLETEAGTLELF